MSRPYLQLNSFKNHSLRRAWRLWSVYSDQQWRNSAYRSFVLGTLVLELDNLIIHSLRAYAISRLWEYQRSGVVPKLNGKYMTSAGYSAQVLRALQPGKFARLGSPSLVGRDDEPVTRDPKDIEKVIRVVVGGVPAELANAISLNGQIFYETKIVRHYYAHRCEDTMTKLVRAVPIFASGIVRHPDDYVDKILPGAVASKYSTWWSEFTDFFSVA